LNVRRIVKRRGKPDLEQLAGAIHLSRSLSFGAVAGVEAKIRAKGTAIYRRLLLRCLRSRVGGKDGFPTEATFDYQIEATFRGNGPAAATELLPELLLPVTTPPAQVPKLLCAAIALSPFAAADDYSSTGQRSRSLMTGA
jgi:hypothetical protein